MKLNKKIKYVSFDLFDTLIKRDVPDPISVFELVEFLFYNDKNSINEFKTIRRNAELDLYTKKRYEEITIDEIYDNFPINIEKKIKNKYRLAEEQMEISVSTFNENIRKLYNNAVKDNKKIIITTDIYLSKKVIEKILEKNNIIYDYLFISSEIRLKKKTGNLYKYIKDILKTNGGDILHIGDNFRSDYINSKKNGIHSIKIPKKYVNVQHSNQYNNHKSYSYLYSFINNRIYKINNYYEKIGYETLGPLLFGFCNWLNFNITKEKIDTILFLSRDGKIMKSAYDIMHKNNKSIYFYASRRALIIPTLYKFSTVEEIMENFSFPKKIKMESLIKKIGLELDENINEKLKKFNYHKDEYINCGELCNKSSRIYLFLCTLIDYVIKNSKKEMLDQKAYFYNHLWKFTSSRIAIVDIGWYGNMQNSFENAINNEKIDKIYGYYIGLVPKFSNKKGKNMNGYLFNSSDNSFENYIREKNYNSLFELLFSANHGTVIKYSSGNTVEFDMLEYSDSQREKIDLIQQGALNFIKDYNSSILSKLITCTRDDYSCNINSLGNNPKYLDVKNLGNLIFFDNEAKKLIEFKSRMYYLFHPKTAINDFLKSQWKIGFLKKLFIIKLPYEKICRKLRGDNIR